MAKVYLSPFIVSLKGHLGDNVFYLWRNIQCARTYVVPANPDTKAQRSVRATFASAVKSWQAMSADEKYKYNRKARTLNMSGYNLYISEFVTVRLSSVAGPGDKQGFAYLPGIQSRIHPVSDTSMNAILIKTANTLVQNSS